MSLILPDTGAEVLPDGRRMVKSAARNAEPILAVLQAESPRKGRMLEIAAGSGLHTAVFSDGLPDLIWQPTDVDAGNFASIRAWSAQSGGSVNPPALLDAGQPGWADDWPGHDAVLLVNLLHLIPMALAENALAGVIAALAPKGVAFVYGPFLRDGAATSPGDAAFDASLRAQNPLIGYKDLAWATARLAAGGAQVSLHEMPANNLMLVARRTWYSIL